MKSFNRSVSPVKRQKKKNCSNYNNFENHSCQISRWLQISNKVIHLDSDQQNLPTNPA